MTLVPVVETLSEPGEPLHCRLHWISTRQKLVPLVWAIWEALYGSEGAVMRVRYS